MTLKSMDVGLSSHLSWDARGPGALVWLCLLDSLELEELEHSVTCLKIEQEVLPLALEPLEMSSGFFFFLGKSETWSWEQEDSLCCLLGHQGEHAMHIL